jgi:rod shape determining protein RodA
VDAGIYALSMLPLMAVYVIGTGKYGQRWLNLGVFYLQPSELLKLSLPLMMAWYLHRQPLPPSPRTVLTAAVLIGVPAVLILMQPNLGTATLVTASGVFALLLAGCTGAGWRPARRAWQVARRWPGSACCGSTRRIAC